MTSTTGHSHTSHTSHTSHVSRASRAEVHKASGSRLGDSDPHQEEAPDLRLVLPALATWAAAVLVLGGPAGWAVGEAAACLVAAVAILAVRRLLPHTAAGVAVAALLCASASAGVAGLSTAELRRGPVPVLAAHQGHATVEVTLTGDPHEARGASQRASAHASPSVVAEADAVRATADGVTTAIRTPVLVIASPEPGAPGSGGGSQAWLRLLPSTRLTLDARLAPPIRPGDRIAAVVYTNGAPRITGGPSLVQRVAGSLRAGLHRSTSGLAPDARALIPGFVVGDTSAIPPELNEAFEATDLTHLLAVSGSNLTLVLALLIGPPALATRAERRGLAARLGLPLRLTALLGGVLTIGFVVLCRPDPSVLRAAVCGLITLLAIGTGRRRSLLPALAAAVIILLLYDPWLARSYGFALSVLATTGLLTLSPRWSEALQRRRVPAHLAEALAAAASTQVFCAPVIAVLAAHISLVAIPCNLLAELAVTPATLLGLGALATAPLSMAVAKAFAWAAGWPADWVAAVARAGGSLPGAALAWPGGWTGGALLAAATVAAVFLARRILRRPWACAVLALLLIVVVLQPAPLTRIVTGWPPPGWRLAVCDVGQGDALVLNPGDGDGTAVVIDTGPEPALADHCLRSLGVTAIPLLVLTHFHADHVSGLPAVLAGRSVGAIEITTLDAPPTEAASVLRRAAAAHIPLVQASAGEHRTLGGLDWRVLWPPPIASALPDQGPNDASVTMLVHTGGLSLMLLGDLEPPAQQELLREIPDLPPVDVVKVAHHGSAYQDPELLRRLHPRLALISVGKDNPYGHPSARTIDALRADGATVLRTDDNGSIAVTGSGPNDLQAVAEKG
jgi:competence protein ComEC